MLYLMYVHVYCAGHVVFVVCTYVCLSADAIDRPPLRMIVVVDAVHHVGHRTRTEQLTTRSSNLVEFILESVFRRIPSPKCASALWHNVLVLWHVQIHSGKQSGRREGDPFGPWIALIVARASFSSS
jgi:hypothetical protein